LQIQLLKEMKINDLIKEPTLMNNMKSVRNEENNVLTLVDNLTKEVVYTFQFDTYKEMVVADCNLFNAKLAQAMLDRTCEYATHFKVAPNKSHKTGFKR
jgi:hypothetical protein